MRVSCIEIETFAYETEDVERVKKAIRLILPERVKIREEIAKGTYGNIIRILRARTRRKGDIKRILEKLSQLSEEEKEKIRREAHLRVDDHGFLNLRIDKALAYLGELKLGRRNPIKIRIKISSHPFSLEKVIEIVKRGEVI